MSIWVSDWELIVSLVPAWPWGCGWILIMVLFSKQFKFWAWDPEEERRRQEKWQQEQERLLQVGLLLFGPSFRDALLTSVVLNSCLAQEMHGLSFFSEVVESKFIRFVSMRQNARCLIPPTGGYTDEHKEKKKDSLRKKFRYWLRAHRPIHHLLSCQSNSSPAKGGKKSESYLMSYMWNKIWPGSYILSRSTCSIFEQMLLIFNSRKILGGSSSCSYLFCARFVEQHGFRKELRNLRS